MNTHFKMPAMIAKKNLTMIFSSDKVAADDYAIFPFLMYSQKYWAQSENSLDCRRFIRH
jgi:hypothetical protein